MSKNAEHLEDISQLKARYFRLMDTQQWDSWHDCFIDNVSATYEGAPRISKEEPEDIHITGREELVEGVKKLMTGACSMHQGFMPEIEILSDEKATGIWAMFDYVRLPTCNFKGWGHYHEVYVRSSEGWKIEKIHLTRLHTEEEWV